VTKMGDNFRCYSDKVFLEQFAEHEPGAGYFFEESPDPDEYTPVPLDDQGGMTVAHNVFDEESGKFKLVITPPGG